MQLTNISHEGRTINLFLRDKEGNLSIETDDSFFPYYYDQCPEGKCLGYDGVKLKKLFVSHPAEIHKRRTPTSYNADIQYNKQYLIDRVSVIDKTFIRWMMMDIETLSKTLPKPFETKKARDPISCISLYDNLTKEYNDFYLGDFKKESDLWEAFCAYVKQNAPDLIIAHNMAFFDYPYLYYRIPKLAEKLSPIGKSRYGKGGMDYPAGISIIDSLEMIKKITLNKEESYGLENLMVKYLGHDKGEYSKIDFALLNRDLVGRCRGDVEGMVGLEEKFQMIPHYDMIRRISKIEWEDFNYNSRVIDMFLLEEAKLAGVVLPTKPTKDDNADDAFEGAFRDAFKTGVFHNIGKYDLSGAYMYAIINLCLDSVNIVDVATEDSILIDVKDRVTQEIVESYNVIQNEKALLPRVVEKLVTEKNKLKALLNATNPESPEYEDIEKKYAAFKTVVLSSWGVIGNKYFRRYDKRVAAMVTGIVRDLLHYTFDELAKLGYETIYVDTDSVFVDDKGENLEPLLNEIVNKWAMDRFNKKVDIVFDHEGHFTKLLLIAKCRYYSYLDTGHGIKKEVKGVEVKRKDSTKFLKKFQETLIEKVFDIKDSKESKESIIDWIESEKKRIKTLPLKEISIPAKLSKKPEDYKVIPISLRSINETPNFKKEVGEEFYYVYVTPEEYILEKEAIEYYREVPGKREGTVKKEVFTKTKLESFRLSHCTKEKAIDVQYLVDKDIIKKNEKISKVKKYRDVMAFDEKGVEHLREVDWDKMIARNITNKSDAIFEAMGW